MADETTESPLWREVCRAAAEPGSWYRQWLEAGPDLPPEAQGLPPDGLYGCTPEEITQSLRTKARLRWGYEHEGDWYGTFDQAKAWLLKDMGLT